MTKHNSDKAPSNTFDCLSCGATYWLKEEAATCPDCLLPMRLRPGSEDKPDYWLIWACACSEPCEACQWGRAWALAELTRLALGGKAQTESEIERPGLEAVTQADPEPMRLL